MNKFHILNFLAILVLSMSSNAMAVTIMGSTSCGDWISNKPVDQQPNWPHLLQRSWLVGYLSGISVSEHKDMLKDASASSLFLWMDNYCQKNPLDDIQSGGTKLFEELLRRKGS